MKCSAPWAKLHTTAGRSLRRRWAVERKLTMSRDDQNWQRGEEPTRQIPPVEPGGSREPRPPRSGDNTVRNWAIGFVAAVVIGLLVALVVLAADEGGSGNSGNSAPITTTGSTTDTTTTDTTSTDTTTTDTTTSTETTTSVPDSGGVGAP